MMENNYAYSKALLRLVPGRGGAAHLRVVGGGLRRGQGVRRGARERGSAQRLRATRSSCSTSTCAADRGIRPVERRLAGRRPALLQRLRPERGAQGAHGLGRLARLQPVPRRGPGQAVRRHRTATATASSSAISSTWTTWSASTSGCSSTATCRASSTAAPDARRPSTKSPRRSSTRVEGVDLSVAGDGREGIHRIHPVPAAAGRQVPELHPGRPRAGCARRGTRVRSAPWRRASPATCAN